jgi:integrase
MALEEPKIAQGFDRNIDYKDMKKRLIKYYNAQIKALSRITKARSMKTINNRILYTVIAMIQLRNGARISESVDAMRQFINKKNFDEKVLVKIAKSETTKYKKDTGEKYTTKKRYRKIMFPTQWIDCREFKRHLKNADFYMIYIQDARMKKRVLDFLLNNFNCNTHSLRYAFINYMLYVQKRPMNDVAKFVGHSSVNQLVTYTQLKNTEQIFDLDI